MIASVIKRAIIFLGIIFIALIVNNLVRSVSAEIPPSNDTLVPASATNAISERELDAQYKKLLKIEADLLREMSSKGFSFAEPHDPPQTASKKKSIALEIPTTKKSDKIPAALSPEQPKVKPIASAGCDKLAAEISEGFLDLRESLRETIVASNSDLSKKIKSSQENTAKKVVAELKDATAILESMDRNLAKISDRADEEEARYALSLPGNKPQLSESSEAKAALKTVPAEVLSVVPDSQAPAARNFDRQPYFPPILNEFPIATVSAERAPVLIGPGRNEVVLTTLKRGTQLPVERIRGSWYRVLTPSGGRVWIHSSYVQFSGSASQYLAQSDAMPSKTF